jgi:glucose/arabinose dehydrogenase
MVRIALLVYIMKRFFLIAALAMLIDQALGQISKPIDAPKPLSPAESLKRVELPDGFRLELIVAEPLIRQPSGVCWDAHGNLFVSELHGYNREGQYDIEELNKTGKLDRVVRRIAANEDAMRRAEAEQLGTVKKMIDDDGDGTMDRAEIWADGLPACLGICPARDGIIAVCAPDIVFLADRDGDGKAEVRDTLFTGFKVSVIERRINSPQWGPENWIYIDGGQGGRINGPKLRQPIDLPVTGFRIKPDGSAIEPVSGHTSTYGFTFNADGDRFVISTGTPGIQIAPLPWR